MHRSHGFQFVNTEQFGRRLRSAGGRRSGFTLIELLVVIAIIALLIAILLPALKNVRSLAKRIKSMSNIRQINISSAVYRDDHKGYMPLMLSTDFGRLSFTNTIGWSTWSFGGKNASAYWANPNANNANGIYDVLAADRPLNPYLTQIAIQAPVKPLRMSDSDPRRVSLQIEVYKDPSDVASYQRSATFSAFPTSVDVSSYDDVGTSYHFNVKWWRQIYVNNAPFDKAFYFGCQRLRISDAFQPSRMVWVNDQYSDVVANNVSSKFKLKNGFGDINKSVMGFMDSHVGYFKVNPGDNYPGSYTNKDYTFVFEDLHLPTNW